LHELEPKVAAISRLRQNRAGMAQGLAKKAAPAAAFARTAIRNSWRHPRITRRPARLNWNFT